MSHPYLSLVLHSEEEPEPSSNRLEEVGASSGGSVPHKAKQSEGQHGASKDSSSPAHPPFHNPIYPVYPVWPAYPVYPIYPMATIRRPLAPLAPAPYRPPPAFRPAVTFFDLPAELRIEIYKLALRGVRIKILPEDAEQEDRKPLPLARASRQVRSEVLPLMHAMCPIRSVVKDFDFGGLLLWLSRIPPSQQGNICKNDNVRIDMETGATPPRNLESLRKWLHMRADHHRAQAKWTYHGHAPNLKVCREMRRRVKRMNEQGKREELIVILQAIKVPLNEDLAQPSVRRNRRG